MADLVTSHDRAVANRRELVRETATVTRASDAARGTWVAIVTDGDYDGTPGMPPNLPYIPDLNAVAASGVPVRRNVHVDGQHVQLLTEPRAGGQVQAMLDLAPTDRARRRSVDLLLTAMFVVVLLALAGGRRART